MASVWKRGGRANKGGTYFCSVVDHSGQRPRRLSINTGTTDRGAAQEVARRVVKLLNSRVSHRVLDADLTDWLANLPYRLRRELVRAGILTGPYAAEGRPLVFHLIGYAHALKAKEDDPRHIRGTVRRIAHVLKRSAMQYWADVTPGKVSSI